jgi:MEDS: MEthanogen/methylotroph, DcmR Sensory domain
LTQRHGEHGRHPGADRLARFAAAGARNASLRAHVQACGQCRGLVGRLKALPAVLAGQVHPSIPGQVAIRVDAILAMQSAERAAAATEHRDWPARRQGIVGSAAGLVPFGHVCWAYRERGELAARGLEYAADGLAAGQYVEFVGPAGDLAFHAELAEQAARRAGHSGARPDTTGIRDLSGYYVYRSPGVVAPEQSVATLLAACDDALSAGYTGVRTIVDATSLTRTAEQRDAYARFEYLIDRKMRTLPVGSLCACDAGELGPASVAELACLHPCVSAGAAPFRLYAEENVDFAIAGTIAGRAAEDLLRAALRLVSLAPGRELVVDARRADSISEGAVATFHEYARDIKRTAVIRRGMGRGVG